MKINEIFTSVQGEGVFAGMPCIFIRLTGCNLRCPWCDTKGALNDGEEMNNTEIIKEISKYIFEQKIHTIIFTGGEPLIQKEPLVDLIKSLRSLIKERIVKVDWFRERFFHLETNGTIDMDVMESSQFSWITVSPKPPKYEIKIKRVNELKYVVNSNFNIDVIPPQYKFQIPIWFQPESSLPENITLCYHLVMNNPWARMGFQLHKVFGFQ